MIRTLTFTETTTGLTYTATTSVPAGARLLDVLCETSAAWTAATALLNVGDSDSANGLLDGQDVQSIAFQNAQAGSTGAGWGDSGGDGAPYSGSGTGKLYPTGDTITAVITATVPGGPTGVTTVSLLLELPTTARRAAAA